MADKTSLLVDLRATLNGPEITELSEDVLTACLEKSLDAYSQFYPIEYFYYDTTAFILVADQVEYSLPSDTIGVSACRIYATEVEIKANRKYFKQYEDSSPGDTGYGGFKWELNQNKIILDSYPTATDAGKYIACLLQKAHIFVGNAIDSIDRATLEGSVLDYAKGEAMETWAGYQGDVSYGSARESRENIRKEGQRLKAEARTLWGTCLI